MDDDAAMEDEEEEGTLDNNNDAAFELEEEKFLDPAILEDASKKWNEFGRQSKGFETTDVSSHHSLTRPLLLAQDILIPSNSTSPGVPNAVHVYSSTLQRRPKLPLPGPVRCATLVAPDILIMGSGKSHSVVKVPLLENETEEEHVQVKSFKWHLADVTALATMDHIVASGGKDGQIYLCDVTNVSTKAQFPDPVTSHNVGPHEITSVEPLDKNLLSWTTNRGHIQLFDIRNSRVVASFLALPRPIADHAVFENVAIIGFQDAMVQLIDLRTMLPHKTLRFESLDKLSSLSLTEDHLCAFGSGFAAFRKTTFLKTPASLGQIFRLSSSDDLWQGGCCLSGHKIFATTSAGFLHALDLDVFSSPISS